MMIRRSAPSQPTSVRGSAFCLLWGETGEHELVSELRRPDHAESFEDDLVVFRSVSAEGRARAFPAAALFAAAVDEGAVVFACMIPQAASVIHSDFEKGFI